MATKEEWREYFELTQGRTPTIEEFTAAMKAGEITDSKEGGQKNQEVEKVYEVKESLTNLDDKANQKQSILSTYGEIVKKQAYFLGAAAILEWLSIFTGIGQTSTNQGPQSLALPLFILAQPIVLYLTYNQIKKQSLSYPASILTVNKVLAIISLVFWTLVGVLLLIAIIAVMSSPLAALYTAAVPAWEFIVAIGIFAFFIILDIWVIRAHSQMKREISSL